MKQSMFPVNTGRNATLDYNKFLDIMFGRDLPAFKRLIAKAHWQVTSLLG